MEEETVASNLPTQEEINELANSDDFYRTNLFKLQVAELLNEIKIKPDKTKEIQQELHTLKTTLEKLPEDKITTKYIKKLNISLYNPKESPRLEFKFKSPISLQVIGSFLLNTTCKPKKDIDLLIEMPPVSQFNFNLFFKKYFSFILFLFLFYSLVGL